MKQNKNGRFIVYNLKLKTPALKNGFAVVHWAGCSLIERTIMSYLLGVVILIALYMAVSSLRKAVRDIDKFDLWNKKSEE